MIMHERYLLADNFNPLSAIPTSDDEIKPKQESFELIAPEGDDSLALMDSKDFIKEFTAGTTRGEVIFHEKTYSNGDTAIGDEFGNISYNTIQMENMDELNEAEFEEEEELGFDNSVVLEEGNVSCKDINMSCINFK
jgi:hypothetical protein